MESFAQSEQLEVLRPEWGTKPRLYYKNLYRFTKCFIGGSVAVERGGVVDCVAGARATLARDGTRLAEARTDSYGDFKFDGLERDSGAYTIEVSHPDHGRKIIDARLGESQYLDVIYLGNRSVQSKRGGWPCSAL